MVWLNLCTLCAAKVYIFLNNSCCIFKGCELCIRVPGNSTHAFTSNVYKCIVNHYQSDLVCSPVFPRFTLARLRFFNSSLANNSGLTCCFISKDCNSSNLPSIRNSCINDKSVPPFPFSILTSVERCRPASSAAASCDLFCCKRFSFKNFRSPAV